MAAGEDEAETVVFQVSHLLRPARIMGIERERRHLLEQFPPARLPAETVDGAVASGRRDPAARIGREPVHRPLA